MSCLLKWCGTVDSYSYHEEECIPASGKHYIQKYAASLVGDCNVKAEFYIKDVLSWCSHESGEYNLDGEEFDSNGTTDKVKIKIINDTGQSETLGAYIEGR